MANPLLLTDIFTPALAPLQFLALAVPQQQHLPAVPVPEPLFGQDTLPNPMPPGYMIPIAIYLDNLHVSPDNPTIQRWGVYPSLDDYGQTLRGLRRQWGHERQAEADPTRDRVVYRSPTLHEMYNTIKEQHDLPDLDNYDVPIVFWNTGDNIVPRIPIPNFIELGGGINQDTGRDWVQYFLDTPYNSHDHAFALNDYYHQQGIIIMAYKAGILQRHVALARLTDLSQDFANQNQLLPQQPLDMFGMPLERMIPLTRPEEHITNYLLQHPPPLVQGGKRKRRRKRRTKYTKKKRYIAKRKTRRRRRKTKNK